MARYQAGDLVIYRVSKHSVRPGPRARNIVPTTKGESYAYEVDKFWVVVETCDTDCVRLRTRTGKEHVVPRDSINLRHARWWEKWLYRQRFPQRPVAPPAD
jgi:hypothetical protein